MAGTRRHFKHARSLVKKHTGKFPVGVAAAASKLLGSSKFKRGGSKTKRGGKKRKLNLAADDLHAGMSMNTKRFVVFKKPSETIIPRSLIRYSYTEGMHFTGVPGIQTNTQIGQLSNFSQWTVSTAFPASRDQSCVRYFDLNPNQKLSGSTFITGSVPANDKLCLMKSQTIFDVANFQNAGCFIKIYVYKCVKDTDEDIVTTWTSATQEQAMGVALAVAPTVGNAQSAPGYLPVTMPYSAPHDLPVVAKTWRLVAEESFDLASTAIRKVRFDGIHNDVGDEIVMTQVDLSYRRGMVQFLMTVVGQPIYDATTGVTNTSYGPINIGLTQKTILTFKSVKAGPQRLQGQYAQFGTSANSAVANTKIMDYAEAAAQIIPIS